MAKRLGVNRRMVRQAMVSAIPPERKVPARARPKLEPVKDFIDEILRADQQAPSKQRHTAQRIWQRIREEWPGGESPAESTVRHYVCRRKHELGMAERETFVPQTYDWGQEAQVDWYEAFAEVMGEMHKLHVFSMRSMAGGGAFHRAYYHATQQAFLEEHELAFGYFGGVFRRLRYDNLKSAVKRLSSTDRSLKLRMRLASNPGNAGAAWHKAMFLRNGCPVHTPERCEQPGQLYFDARWPSDNTPLRDPDGNGFSVAFIPGRLSDHNLLDDEYVYRLRMMSGSLSAAMEQGCWCELQGAYFANWNASRMVIPWTKIGANWWDSHFLSIDYGHW